MEVKVDIVPFLRLMVRSQTSGLDKHTDEIRKLLSTIDSALETTKVKIAEEESGEINERRLNAMKSYEAWLNKMKKNYNDILASYEIVGKDNEIFEEYLQSLS